MRKGMKYLFCASVAFGLLFGTQVLAKEKKSGSGKKPVARAARRLSLEEQFKKFDLNKDGKITLDEARKSGLLEALQKRAVRARPVNPQRRREMMQRMRQHWQTASPVQGGQARRRQALGGELRERMSVIPPEKRKELAKQLRELPPDERREKIRAILKEVGPKYARRKFLDSLSPRQRELYLQMVSPKERERLQKYFRELEKKKGREEFFRSLSPEQRRWLLQSAPREKVGELRRILRALPARPARPTLRGPQGRGEGLGPFRLRPGRESTPPALTRPEGPRPSLRKMPGRFQLKRGRERIEPRRPGKRPRVEMKGTQPQKESPAEGPPPKLFRNPLASPEILPFSSGEGLLEDWDIFENWDTLESLGAFGE